jgi:hypothetical protein
MGRRIPNYGEVESAMESEYLQDEPATKRPQQESQGGSDPGQNISPARVVVPISPQGPQPPTTEEEARQRRADRRDGIRLGVEIAALFIGTVGLFALIQTLSETRRSVDVAVDNAHMDQRAWVIPSKVIVPPEVKEGVPLVFGVQVVNSGKTPALNMGIVVVGEVWPRSRSFVPRFKGVPVTSPERSIGTLLPTTPVTAPMEPTILTKEQSERFRSNAVVLYLYGEVSYQDVFNKPHCTMFCFTYAPKEGTHVWGKYNDIADTKCEHIQ